jgi:5-methylcytosine-specific restriction endonuclease McrA
MNEVRCRVCLKEPVDWHHVVPRSATRFGKDTPYNLIPLCRDCHRHHHERTKLISRRHLRDAEIAFALGAMGPAWLDTWYPA